MDAEHEAVLARILAERQRRGDLLDKRSISGRQDVIDQTQRDIQHEQELSRQREQRLASTSTNTDTQQQQQYPSSPQPTSAFQTRAAPDASPPVVGHNPALVQQQQYQRQPNLNQRDQTGNANVNAILSQQQSFGNQQQQQSMMGEARPLPVLGASNVVNQQQNQNQNQNQQQQQAASSTINTNVAATPSPYRGQQQQQQQQAATTNTTNPTAGTTSSSSFIERGKFINFRKAPILEMNDIRKLRPYVKGEKPNHREINFQGQKVVHQLNAPDHHQTKQQLNAAGDNQNNTTAGVPQTPQQGNFRSGSTVPMMSNTSDRSRSAARGQSVVSQQRYPNQGGGAATPSVAQLAQSARRGAGGGNNNNNNNNMSLTTRRIHETQQELAAQISEKNPFRTQTFDEFSTNPDERTVPLDVLEIMRDAKNLTQKGGTGGSAAVWNHKGQQLTAPQEGAVSQPMVGKALFNFTAACSILIQGDWFLKWTRHKDKVHRRYFKISQDGELFQWAKSPDASLAFSSVVRISDFASIEPSCVVDEVTSQTIYVMTIWSTTRVTQLGTEYREKFDIWYETLRRLAQKHRTQNHAFSSRHATLVASDQTAAATAMTMRQGLMGGKISSAD